MAKTGTSRMNPGKGSAGSISQGRPISSEEHQRMIAEAAYFRAMERGFSGGNPVDDWLIAEREINHLLPARQRQK